MARHAAELATIRTLVEELQARVLGLTKESDTASREDLVRALFEAERSLRSAGRQLARAEKLLG
jgi:ribosomal protein S12 methylthiotransferase accessory factor YcaO